MTSALSHQYIHMKVSECQMHSFLSQTLDNFMLCILLLNESHFLEQVQVLMGHQIQRGFISLPKMFSVASAPREACFMLWMKLEQMRGEMD